MPAGQPQTVRRRPAVANRNKQKGDRAERAVRDWAAEHGPGSFKTRAGFNDDMGDILWRHPAGYVVLQVKDVARPVWSTWFDQLADQVATATREVRDGSGVQGGAIIHKVRGVSDPAQWRAVLPLEALEELLDNVYEAGLDQGHRRARGLV